MTSPSTRNNGSALPEEIQNLGRKARARLEAERSKRREIHRVEIPPPEAAVGDGTTTDHAPRHSALIDAAIQEATSKKAAPKKRKRVVNRKADAGASAAEVDNGIVVDRWMPNVSSIPHITSKESRSSLVQLHGLPLETTSNHILRFFSGLDPQRILYVAAMAPGSVVRIQELDADHVATKKTDAASSSNCAVRRHGMGTRLFVKFQSAPTATLACHRSGEVLHVAEKRGARIAVTAIAKATASYILKHMAVDVVATATSGDGTTTATTSTTIENFQTAMESKLDPSIGVVLWQAAIADLRLKVLDGDGPTDTVAITSPSFRTNLSYRQALSLQEQDELRVHIAQLKTKLNRLQVTTNATNTTWPLLLSATTDTIAAIDPTLLQANPILNLTNKCVTLLHAELERSTDLLAMARRWSMLQSSATSSFSTTRQFQPV